MEFISKANQQNVIETHFSDLFMFIFKETSRNAFNNDRRDAIGIATFEQRHCEHCLTKTSKTGVVTYFQYVLGAKIVTTTGLSISLASEFIENDPGRDMINGVRTVAEIPHSRIWGESTQKRKEVQLNSTHRSV